MSLTAAPVSPKAAPLPPIPGQDPLSPAQWKTLLAIADAIIPTIAPIASAHAQKELPVGPNEYATAISTLRGLAPDSEGEGLAELYLRESASSNPAFREAIHRLVALYMPTKSRNELGFVLNILG